MERRTLLARLAGAAGAMVALRPIALFGDNCKEKSQKSGTTVPCVLPSAGPRAGYFPNVVLINQDYEKARFYDDLVRGKIVTFNSFSTRLAPSLPGQIMANLVELQKFLGDRVGRDIFMYSVTYDAGHDTPQVLHEYAERLGIRPGWSLLTGQPRDVNLVLARLGLGYMKMGHDVMEPHYGLIRMGNDVLDRWTVMPAIFSPHLLAHHLSLVEVKPERKDPKQFVRAGPFPRNVAEMEPGKTAAKATSDHGIV